MKLIWLLGLGQRRSGSWKYNHEQQSRKDNHEYHWPKTTPFVSFNIHNRNKDMPTHTGCLWFWFII